MIKVKIIGGLGNQLFQYATAYSCAKYHNSELLIDISDAVNYKLHDLRLTHLHCNATFETDKSFLDQVFLNTKIGRFISRSIGLYYIEKNLTFSNDVKKLSKNKKLIGYFQNEKYFSDVRDDLIEQFKPKHSFSVYQNEILELMQKCNSLSIHIRRGDFLSDLSANKVHGICDISYFDRAIDYLTSNNVINPLTKVFVFSDDIEWCKQNAKFNFETIYINDDFNKPELDMWLMSKCNNHIISNSTFSWWGAWLNSDSRKTVVAPKQWFANGMNTDVQPNSWIML